ncbi:hypothetical protein MBFIL_14510 [Methanobrevibacter filiformis]|uniref:Uncharacterized protein n=1 Tax=Methanobrevibacter filiformis TaxID=55758 RepID=A0A166A1J5_9EURY|nr:hypothetical protein MBFIL_14510 [Methanobrevibacter filiformis]
MMFCDNEKLVFLLKTLHDCQVRLENFFPSSSILYIFYILQNLENIVKKSTKKITRKSMKNKIINKKHHKQEKSIK